MHVVRGLPRTRVSDVPSSVAIGNFDGVHKGHLGLIRRAQDLAARIGGQSVVVTFSPLTREFFAGDKAPARLQRNGEKLMSLCEAGVDATWLLRFDKTLSALEPESFLSDVLLRAFDVKHLIMGSDFRFGRGRSGSIEGLMQLSKRLNFEVSVVEPVNVAGTRVSSTSIRRCLAENDFAGAADLLGRPFSMEGRVIYGRQLGRELGYPTANMKVNRVLAPIEGIFAVKVHGVSEAPWPGVASLGRRPTLGDTELLLETHLFDFDENLYGRRLRIEFVAKLRDEAHFESLEALTIQMNEDARNARLSLEQSA